MVPPFLVNLPDHQSAYRLEVIVAGGVLSGSNFVVSAYPSRTQRDV